MRILTRSLKRGLCLHVVMITINSIGVVYGESSVWSYIFVALFFLSYIFVLPASFGWAKEHAVEGLEPHQTVWAMFKDRRNDALALTFLGFWVVLLTVLEVCYRSFAQISFLSALLNSLA
jgi:hypothetical protein